MKFTFGIITDGKNVARVRKIVASINNLGISPNKHEIIVVCPRAEQYGADTILYVFDETKKPLWITAKKNMITKIASHENIVYLHDYISFNENWYKGFLKMELSLFP